MSDITLRLTSQDLDLDGDVVVTSGIDWSLYKLHAPVYVNHDLSEDPVGFCRRPDGALDVDIREREVFGGCTFHKLTAPSREAAMLADKRILGAASIGFYPVQSTKRGVKGSTGREGEIVHKSLIREWSLVGRGACPSCVAVSGPTQCVGGNCLVAKAKAAGVRSKSLLRSLAPQPESRHRGTHAPCHCHDQRMVWTPTKNASCGTFTVASASSRWKRRR